MQLGKFIWLLCITLFFLIIAAGCGGGTKGLASGIATGSITLSWDAPSNNSDGSPITDLAGYKIYYGSSPDSYTESVDLGNFAGATISNLTAGTWCFATTAYDTSGNESSLSNEVCTEIQV